MTVTWYGRDINELTREELVEALTKLAKENRIRIAARRREWDLQTKFFVDRLDYNPPTA